MKTKVKMSTTEVRINMMMLGIMMQNIKSTKLTIHKDIEKSGAENKLQISDF